MSAMCWPVSPSLDCISTSAGEECIVTGYGQGICTKDEAQAVESAVNAAYNAEGNFYTLDDTAKARANERANAAFQAIVRRIQRGDHIVASTVASTSSGGCAG